MNKAEIFNQFCVFTSRKSSNLNNIINEIICTDGVINDLFSNLRSTINGFITKNSASLKLKKYLRYRRGFKSTTFVQFCSKVTTNIKKDHKPDLENQDLDELA